MANTKASKSILLDKLPKAGHPLFYVGMALYEAQLADALNSVYNEMHRRQRSRVTTLALCGAVIRQEHEVSTLVRECISKGLLLFCFEGTTALQGAAA